MRGKIAALAIAGGALMALTAPMSTAQAAPSTAFAGCTPWHDSNTYGAGACTGFSSGDRMQASAKCNNGQWAYGNTVSATNGSKSYANQLQPPAWRGGNGTRSPIPVRQ